MRTFSEDFNYMWNRVFIEKKPTVFARYADGEAGLIKGNRIGPESMVAQVDGWQAPQGITELGKDLQDTLTRVDPNYFYAISCQCCDRPTKEFLLSLIKQKPENITYANLWINGNYNEFKNKISTIKETVYIIGNSEGEGKKYPFDTKLIPIGNDCINFWKNNKVSFLKSLLDYFVELEAPLVLVAAGPMSEVIVDFLWSINKTGRYIDVGSALDEYIRGRKTRSYMDEYSDFNRRICQL
jgi:hypothetical protein